MKRKALAASLAALFALSGASAALGNANPPTGAGNGGGHSGQCTGPASERPAVCPGT
jgi:Spy/CpxP family protein refolding chaperone